MAIYTFFTSLFRGFSNFFKNESHRFLAAKNPKVRRDRHTKSLGFTLIEVLVVVVFAGILTAIAAPSWLGFVNNQRINSSQTKIFQAIKSAQSEAKVRSDNSDIGRTKITFTFPNSSGKSTFKLENVRANSGKEQSLEDGVIISSVTFNGASQSSPTLIQFDSRGFVYDPSTTQIPICVTLSFSGNTQKKSWVKIQTLLGAVSTGKDSACT